MQEAEEAFAALQVLDNRNEEEGVTTNDETAEEELLRSLEDIEPEKLSEIVDDSDLALLSSDIAGLFSDDPNGPSVVSDDEQEDESQAKPSSPPSVPEEKDIPVGATSSNTTATTLAVDTLPEIEFDFGEDPFLVDSEKLHNIFDVVDQDTESREDNEVGSLDDERRLDFEKLVGIEEQSPLPPLAEDQQQANNPNEEGELLQHPVVEGLPLDVDLETEELYNELAKMSLTEKNRTANENLPLNDQNTATNADTKPTTKAERKKAAMDLLMGFDTGPAPTPKPEPEPKKEDKKKAAMDLLMGFDTGPAPTPKTEPEPKKQDKKKAAMDLLMEDPTSASDGLSPYLFCQPCTQEDFNTMAGTEEEIVERDREQHMRDLKALYAASAVSRDDLPPLDYSDPLLRELQAQYEYEQSVAHQMHWEQQQQQIAEQIEYERQQQEAYERIWTIAKHWGKAFAVDLDKEVMDVSGERKATPAKDTSKTGFGHKETIFGVSFSEDGKYVATACQDATIGIWEVAKNKLVKTLKGHDKNYECLRVDWSSRIWAQDILDRESKFSNLMASAGADGTVKIWSCADKKGGEVGHPEPDNEWKCEYTLDHANLKSVDSKGLDVIAEEEEDDEANEKKDKPQVYSLQFIDHWDIFTKNLKDQVCAHHSKQVEKEEEETKEVDENFKNSFLMTSSEEFIHLWELESHSMDNQLKLNDEKIRILQDKIKLKEVMSLHFGALEEYTYGVTVCSVTGTGMKLPPPPSGNKKPDGENGETGFGGPRNPENTVFVFDAAYCPGSGLLGVALSDGSLRLINGRGACISVIQVPGNKSHLTSFCWDKSGTRLATCVATGHLITWTLDAESHDRGNYNTVATCTAIFEGGHQSGRPLYGSRFCGGEDENLLLSWGVDGKICMWYSQSQGNIYDPVAVLRDDASYPIYNAAVSPTERNLVVGGGGDGGFIGVPLHFYGIPPLENEKPKVEVVHDESS